MFRAALTLLLGLSITLQAQAGRTSTPLDGAWRFQRTDVAGAEAPGFDDAAWTAVALPHTYNADDGETGGTPYRGAAWYRRTLDVPPGAATRRFLEFDAATLAADVWVNGRHAGRHEGGYARFRFNITSLLRPGRNVLAVRVDNSKLPQVAPLGGDFTVFGGLIRPVRLIETADTHIELLDHGGPGVRFDIEALDADQARLKVQLQWRNDGAAPARRELRLTLRDAQGRSVVQQIRRLDLLAGAADTVTAILNVPKPHLWQGIKDPYLYRLSAELMDGREVADAVQLPVGLRQFGVDPERGFLLNGKPYPLYGVNYFHTGRPGRGVAVGRAEIDEDLRILMDLGLTGLRLVHYQHPAYTYERADELGLVLWTEIPLNSAMQETPAFRDNLYGQLRELVRQNRHHASVAVWGVGNEVYRSDEPIRALLADLHALAKREDPARLTSYAHCCAPDDHPMALATDLASYNRYWGWYDGQFSDIGPWADKLHARLPAKPIGLGEYGAGASALQQEDPPRRPEPGGRWHPEQYQALFHEAYAAQLEKRPYLWGRFIWLGFDHAAANRHEGDTTGRNDKGLVTYDRRLLKDAYHLMRAWWQSKPVLHIASQRLATRPTGPVAIKAYSNAAKATLQLNGKTVGTVDVVDRIAVWPAVELTPGRVTLQVSDDRGSKERVDLQIEGCGPEALGTSRVLQLPREGAAHGGAYGRLPLAANEFVLSFDDGPRPGTTERVLQALKAECARATFFMNGEPMLQHPALAQRVRAEGHTVAMHGFKHLAFGELPAKDQLADLEAMQKAYRYVIGGEPAAWRFPYLAETPTLREALRQQKVTVMSVEPGIEDWVPGKTPEMMAEGLLAALRQTGGGIVLLHDVQEQTAAALPLMLRRLKQEGWRLVHLQWPESPR
ncbi:beta-galactosidase [Pelomonas saccharophila]|uniref:Beta-galactosidase n=1 Tax=Roseateles saccharophilus TaxID=304 RepID=A0ABU1YST7_ROSSA|nr:polysaccharide deacetylase family protein [Roseateles saccharophilus]MDR7271913.1 beta-galactosidase [Roseateles saccharophilus]